MKRRILLVDDEAAVRRILQLRLEQTGRYSVHTVADSTQALAAARACRPDIILLDVMMPGLDGGEVADQMRHEPDLKDTPILFLTSLVSSTRHRGPFGKGSALFVPKPVDLPHLLSRIEELTDAGDHGGRNGFTVSRFPAGTAALHGAA